MSVKEKKTAENTAILFLAAIGMACLLGGLFCVFFSSAPLFMPERQAAAMPFRIAFLFGLMAISIFSAISHGYLFALKSLAWHKAIAFCLMFLPLAVSLVSLGFTVPDLAWVLIAFFAGCGYALFMVFWADAVRPFWHYQVGIYVASGFLAGALLALFAQHMEYPFAFIFYAFLLVISILSLEVCRCYMGIKDAVIPVRGEKFPLSLWHELLIGCYGLAGGAFIARFCFLAPEFSIQQWLAAAVMAAAAAYSITLIARRKYLPSGMVQRVICIPFLAALVAAPLVDGQVQIAICLLAISVFVYLDISNYASLVALSDEQHVSPYFVISRGRLFLYGGVSFGTLLGCLASSSDFLLLSFALALVMLILVFVRPFEFNHVSDRLSLADDEEDSDAFKHRCQAIAEAHGLTAREVDVLLLLARGRNAKYIEQELYISLNTAKTHISHIYRKLGISSQQALLDLVDKDSGQ